MATIDWYFDVISPFAYLQFHRLHELPAETSINFRPLLFAGLLDHWGQKGPAEIAPKKTFTYQSCHWRARSMGIPFRMPRAHPFNPLRALRLIVALGEQRAAIGRILDLVWQEDCLCDDDADWARMKHALGAPGAPGAPEAPDAPDADHRIADPAVKARLRQNGEDAIAAGVFGVPTAVAGGHLFWGEDSTDFLIAYLTAPDLFDDPEMARLASLPEAARRA